MTARSPRFNFYGGAMIRDIKDNSPNPDLVEQLERLLDDAKSGEIRSMVWVASWNHGRVANGWAIDRRSSKKLILAELVMLQHDFTVKIELDCGDSILATELSD